MGGDRRNRSLFSRNSLASGLTLSSALNSQVFCVCRVLSNFLLSLLEPTSWLEIRKKAHTYTDDVLAAEAKDAMERGTGRDLRSVVSVLRGVVLVGAIAIGTIEHRML